MTEILTIKSTRDTEIVLDGFSAFVEIKGKRQEFLFGGEVKYLSRLGYHIELGPITAQISSETAGAIKAFFAPIHAETRRRAAEYLKSNVGSSEVLTAKMGDKYSDY